MGHVISFYYEAGDALLAVRFVSEVSLSKIVPKATTLRQFDFGDCVFCTLTFLTLVTFVLFMACTVVVLGSSRYVLGFEIPTCF